MKDVGSFFQFVQLEISPESFQSELEGFLKELKEPGERRGTVPILKSGVSVPGFWATVSVPDLRFSNFDVGSNFLPSLLSSLFAKRIKSPERFHTLKMRLPYKTRE